MAPTLAELRDAAVLREGRLWPDQVRCAASQATVRPTTDHPDKPLANWRAEIDPHDLGLFDLRLERDGLTPETAAAVFSAPDPAQSPMPSWWPSYRRFVEALEHADAASVAAHLATDPELRDTVPFVDLLIPVSAAELDRLTSELDQPLTAGVRRDLNRDLLTRLSQVAGRTFAEVMWRDQPFGTKFLAQSGASIQTQSRSRYLEFCDAHRRDGLSTILIDFPVLGRLVATIVDQWFTTSTSMLTRVARDRAALAQTCGIAADAELTGVRIGTGDRHNRGYAVALLTFGDHTVVYKPRSVALEQIYAEVVKEFSRHSSEPTLVAPDAIALRDEAGDYGYVEFVERRTCDPEMLPTFYRNAGRLLALLHALMATDCHHENLIAVGDQLVLIDAETLLCGTPSDPIITSTRMESGAEPEPGSILRVGMLPSWMWLDGRRKAVDVSALGVDGAPEDQRGIGWRAVNTDAMVQAEVTYPMPHPTSLPGAAGEANRIADFVGDVVDGFIDAYRVLLDGRDTWLAAVLTRAESAHNRAVLRPTYVYGTLLQALTAPPALRSMAASGMVCEQVTRGYLNASGVENWPLARAEQEALARLDVPFFTWPLTGGATRWCDGELLGWPDNDQLAQVRAQLRDLDPDDVQRQVALIRGSIRASGLTMVQQAAAVEATEVGAAEVGAVASAPDMARRSFTQVADAAIRSRGRATWMGSSMLPDGVHANVTQIGAGYYDGRMGLAVGWLLWAQRDPAAAERADALCRDTLEPLLDSLTDRDGAHQIKVSGGTGMAGVGGFLRGLGFLRRSGFEVAAVAAAERMLVDYLTPQIVRDDTGTDVMGGPAGLVAPLVRLLDDGEAIGISRSHVFDLIAASAEALVNRQLPDSGAWDTLRDAPPLTGVAHGASGIALALAEASVALGDSSLLDAALRGLQYESALFDEEAGNWPDLRPDPTGIADAGSGEQRFIMGWCAGAPGIALARWRLIDLLPDHAQVPLWREQMYRAAQTAATAQVTVRDHVCCGNLGRVAILRTLAGALGESRWDDDIDRIVGSVVTTAGSGVPTSVVGEAGDGLAQPGLFTGLPGMGAVLFGGADWVPQLLL